MADIAHPHDHFIKALLSDPEKAGTFLREWLPKEIGSLLSPEPPELLPDSFIDETLREHHTDRLYAVKTISGKTALVYTLVDHKSSPDRKSGWQLLKYMVEIWKQWQQKHPAWKKLPAIIPFIFYHGEAEWRIPDEFLALVDMEEGWRPYLLNYRYSIFDLGKIPDQKLSQQPRLRAWLLAAKYATRGGDQLKVKEFLIEVLADAGEDFTIIVRYMIETYQSFELETFREIIRRTQPEEEVKMMSQFAQEIIAKNKPEWMLQGEQKGWQKGRQEGRQEGSANILLLQLEDKFGSVSNQIRDRVLNADQTMVEQWSLRILKSDTLDAVFDR